MRRLIAASLLAATATVPTSAAFAEDCVTTYVRPLTYSPGVLEIEYVEVFGGSVAVHYDRLISDAVWHVDRTMVLVDCVV